MLICNSIQNSRLIFKAFVKSRVVKNERGGVQLGSKSEILSGSPTFYKRFSFFGCAIQAEMKNKTRKTTLLESLPFVLKTLSTLQASMFAAAANPNQRLVWERPIVDPIVKTAMCLF